MHRLYIEPLTPAVTTMSFQPLAALCQTKVQTERTREFWVQSNKQANHEVLADSFNGNFPNPKPCTAASYRDRAQTAHVKQSWTYPTTTLGIELHLHYQTQTPTLFSHPQWQTFTCPCHLGLGQSRMSITNSRQIKKHRERGPEHMTVSGMHTFMAPGSVLRSTTLLDPRRIALNCPPTCPNTPWPDASQPHSMTVTPRPPNTSCTRSSTGGTRPWWKATQCAQWTPTVSSDAKPAQITSGLIGRGNGGKA